MILLVVAAEHFPDFGAGGGVGHAAAGADLDAAVIAVSDKGVSG